MSTHRACVVPALALFAAACAAGDDEPTLNHYADEMAESLEAVQAEVSAHHQQILVQTDVRRVHAMEQQYMDDIAMHVGRMDDAQASMRLCGEHMDMSGETDSLQVLHRARTAVADAIELASNETDHHLQAMQGAPDVRSALNEEHRHQAEMEPLLDRMRMHDEEITWAMQAMEDEGFSMMCQMASHMHRL